MLYSPERFEFTGTLEKEWRTIRRELDQFLSERKEDEFLDYPGYGPDWQFLLIYAENSAPISVADADHQLAAREKDPNFFPETRRIVATIPGIRHAIFSTIVPGTKLKPHRDPFPGFLRCHLGIVVPEPESCGLRVEGKVARLTEGKTLVFERAAVHEAWNRGSKTRIVLFVDFDKEVAISAAGAANGTSPTERQYYEAYSLSERTARLWQHVRYIYRRIRVGAAGFVKRILGIK